VPEEVISLEGRGAIWNAIQRGGLGVGITSCSCSWVLAVLCVASHWESNPFKLHPLVLPPAKPATPGATTRQLPGLGVWVLGQKGVLIQLAAAQVSQVSSISVQLPECASNQ
jgi:hypothetical protein